MNCKEEKLNAICQITVVFTNMSIRQKQPFVSKNCITRVVCSFIKEQLIKSVVRTYDEFHFVVISSLIFFHLRLPTLAIKLHAEVSQ